MEFAAQAMRRFYREVTLGEAQGGWQVRLDARPIRTQGGAPQVVATLALAEAMADEWRAQGEQIDPHAFPLRDLADLALDRVAADRAGAIARLLAYAGTDTLCYRADPDEPLYQRQLEAWEPLVAACEAACGIGFERVSGIVHRPQPAAALDALEAELAAKDDFALAALLTHASLAASLVAALAVEANPQEAQAIFTAANLEEDWQAGQWGRDEEAANVRAARAAAFAVAADFIRLARKEGQSPPGG